jgi:hypothetical protein
MLKQKPTFSKTVSYDTFLAFQSRFRFVNKSEKKKEVDDEEVGEPLSVHYQMMARAAAIPQHHSSTSSHH